MKKLIFGALALSLMISLISCREESDKTGDSMEEASINEAAPVEVTPEVETEEVDTTAVADSLQTPEQESQIEE